MTDTPDMPTMSTVSPHLVCADSKAAIDFYVAAFGATELMRLPGPSGEIVHAAIQIDGSTVMLVDEMEMTGPSPATLGATPVTLHLLVDDCDAAVDRAVAGGATVIAPPEDVFWGDRYALIADPQGHHWSLASPLGPPMTNEQIIEAGHAEMS